LLILRELFVGSPRFEEMQAQTGVSSHLLSTRLRRLETDGILTRKRYSKRPIRYEYRLTAKGLDLFPVLLAPKAWGEKWSGFRPAEERSTTIVHTGCGHETGLELLCPSCKKPFGARDVEARFGARFTVERTRRRAAFLARRRVTG
jgi:DNA-binding HxlR family transcriptional regulator